MALKVIHDTLDEIPENYRDLYTEKDGKFHLTGITGIKTQTDVDTLTTALRKERDEHKKAKDALKPWTELGVPIEELQEKLEKFPELEAAAKGKLNDDQINEIVDKRVAAKLKPVEKKLADTEKALGEANTTVATLTAEKRTRSIHDAVREVATKANIIPSAIEDVLMVAERVFEVDEQGKVVAKDNVGVIPGITPDVWLSDMQEKRAHWWPASSGGGANGGKGGGGGGGKNPWTADNWNLTEQNIYIKQHGMEKATQMATQVGSKVGAIHPPSPKK